MSKLIRLYNSWDQYTYGDAQRDDEVLLSNMKPFSTIHVSQYSSSGGSFYSNSNINYAVLFKDVKLSYGTGKNEVKILRGINMKVPEGAIYALLGPSGCGKTTLCNCITGRITPTDGTVTVFDKVPGSPGSNVPGPIIGFMPQETSLFPDFSIEETLMFFSRLYRLDPGRASDRIDFLVDFLELPDKRRMVANLSGGQQRRVSLAAALIHSPPLLILDEPTVGVDPVLRQVIWDYLVLLSTKDKLSIIITTHYIEEARSANVCGLMRQGKLLVEESPGFLMEKYKSPTLEAVFLQLSRASDTRSPDVAYDFHDNSPTTSSAPPREHLYETIADQPGTKTTTLTMSQSNLSTLMAATPSTSSAVSGENNDKTPTMKQIALKRDEAALAIQGTGKLTTNGQPVEAILNGRVVPKFERFVIEDRPKSNIGQFMQERRQSCNRTAALTSKNFARLKRNLPVLLFQFLLPSIEVILFCLCIGQEPFNLPVSVFNEEILKLDLNTTDAAMTFSYRYLERIDNRSVILTNFDNELDALESVRKGKSWGAIVIRENFTGYLKLRFLDPPSADTDLIEGSNVHLHLDMSNYLIGLQLQRILSKAFQSLAMDALSEIQLNPRIAELPVTVEEPVYGVREPTFTEFMAPGVLLSISFFAAVALTAIALVQERKEGVLDRCLVAGVTSTEFIMSQVITQILVLTVQVLLLLNFTFLVFEIPYKGPFELVILLTLMQSSCGMAFGLMISAMTKEETSATMLALGSFYPNVLLSGTIWPTQAMPNTMRYIAYCLPQTLPIESLRYILSRGWGLTYPEVYTGFAVTIGWTLFFLIAAVIIFRSKI